MPAAPNPHESPLPSFGKAALFVPLIIGGAVIVSLVMLWEAHAREARLAAASTSEIAARDCLREAWAALRAGLPDATLKKTADAAVCVEALRSAHVEARDTDYAELRAGLFLLEAEALLLRDGAAGAAAAEAKAGTALELLPFSGGGLWEAGLLCRARARHEQGRYADAIHDLDQIMTRNANYGAAYYYRALARENAGDDAGAREDERIARRLGSWPPLRGFLRGVVAGD